MSEGNRKPERENVDPAELAKLLELELIQKRAAWQRARGNRQNLRALSFFFLFLVIAGGLAGAFYLMSARESLNERAPAASTATPSPTPAPR